MSRLLVALISILLILLVGWLFGSILAVLFPVATIAFINLTGLIAFLVGLDLLASDSSTRAFVRNATTVSRWSALLIAGLFVAMDGWAACVLIGMGQFGGFIQRLLGTGGISESVVNHIGIYLSPVISLVGFLLLLGSIDLFAPTQPLWIRVKSTITQDFRSRIFLIVLALVIDICVISLVRWDVNALVTLMIGIGVLGLVAGSLFLIDRLLTSSRIWAVARHTIAEGIRMKIVLVFIAILTLILLVLPFSVAGDGLTLKSRVQSFLAYSLGLASFLLSLLTVFLACATLSNEIRTRQIFMVASKPIPRWQFFVGKWLGISLTNAVLLLITGLSVWGFTWYLKAQPAVSEDDSKALTYEVLNVRHSVKLEEPTDLPAQAEERMRRLREDGRLGDMAVGSQQDLYKQILDDLKRSWRSLPPGDDRTWTFRGLLVDRQKEGFLHLHFKPGNPSGVDSLTFKIRWQCGDVKDVNTVTAVNEREFAVDRFDQIVVPTYAVNKDGTLVVHMQNLNTRDTIVFEGDDSFELLYDLGTFHWNLFRALAIVWCRLAFLAVMGLLASSFLSFPVACMVCFLVLAVASAAGFLGEAIGAAAPKYDGEDPLWVLGPILRPLGWMFVWLVPDFSKFDPVGNVVAGRLVPLMWLLYSLVVLVLLKGLLLGVIGCVVLTWRELAGETT